MTASVLESTEEVGSSAKNDDSLVFRATFGKQSFLLPGDAEKAAEALLGYVRNELQQLRTILVDEFCEVKEGVAFLKPEKLAIRLTLDDSWHQCEDCAQLIWLPLRDTCPNPRCGSKRLIQLPGNDPALRARTDFYREPIRVREPACRLWIRRRH